MQKREEHWRQLYIYIYIYFLNLRSLQKKIFERERENGWFAEVLSFIQKARFIWAGMGRQVPLRRVESNEPERGRRGRI